MTKTANPGSSRWAICKIFRKHHPSGSTRIPSGKHAKKNQWTWSYFCLMYLAKMVMFHSYLTLCHSLADIFKDPAVGSRFPCQLSVHPFPSSLRARTLPQLPHASSDSHLVDSGDPLMAGWWLGVGPPLGKIWVNWDDDSNPIFLGKCQIHGNQSPPTSHGIFMDFSGRWMRYEWPKVYWNGCSLHNTFSSVSGWCSNTHPLFEPALIAFGDGIPQQDCLARAKYTFCSCRILGTCTYTCKCACLMHLMWTNISFKQMKWVCAKLGISSRLDRSGE